MCVTWSLGCYYLYSDTDSTKDRLIRIVVIFFVVSFNSLIPTHFLSADYTRPIH